ncbi:MAG: hypothetical protein E6G85_11500 [Alphaproteobacteria bacterium]|nr:MAG: hypothetical protein E6G85_11500 [Alphaproteobacteria bacterium]
MPGIHILRAYVRKDVDGRVKPGHDGSGEFTSFHSPPCNLHREASCYGYDCRSAGAGANRVG